MVFSAQSSPHGRLVGVLGPTNTGKTHLAVERMLAHESGMMGFPLRLLAREIYDRVVSIKGASRVALITGEERIEPPYADYFLCTTESMPLSRDVAFLAIDEVQMCADADRGHIFTDRLLHARGMEETMWLGSDAMRPIIRRLYGDDAEIIARPRFSRLSYTAPKKLSRLPRRSAIVAFSVADVYTLAELIRRQKGGCAIVMGALSPRTRNAQVELYQSGDVDYLVATDAIGMGLNMDIDLVALAATRKFDGQRFRDLTPAELAQIAGRAGRHMSDGSFTTLAGMDGAHPLDAEVIERIEQHRFEPVKRLMWRSHTLDYSSIDTLIASLEERPDRENFAPARQADDLAVLKYLAPRHNIRERATREAGVRLLWDACQIPDFRKIALDVHARLVEHIFVHLSDGDGRLPEDWFAAQVRRLDNISGDIDTLAARIAGVRVWTYVAHRQNWLKRATHWVEATRVIEDKLSDALHDRLTQRFVDRRTAVLLREMKAKGELMVAIERTDMGDEISVEGHVIGRLEGFIFHVDTTVNSDEAKMLRQAGERALRQEIETRAQALSAAKEGEFTLDFTRGYARPIIKWRGQAVAELSAGDDIYVPRIAFLPGTMLEGPLAAQVLAKLNDWLKTHIETLLDPLIKLRDALKNQGKSDTEVTLGGQARAVGYRLLEALGVLSRQDVVEEVRALDQNARRGLRFFGIRFGAVFIFMPAMLKPAPADLRLALWAMMHAKDQPLPKRPTPGLVRIEMERSAPRGYYPTIGFRPIGSSAVRIDMLERLGDAVRPMGQGGKPFLVGPDLMGLVGASGDDFAAIMRVLGYGTRDVLKSTLSVEEKPAEAAPPPAETQAVEEQAAETQAVEEAAVVEDNPAPQVPTVEVEDPMVTAFVWEPRQRAKKPHPQHTDKSKPQAKHTKGAKGARAADGKKPHKAPRPAKKEPEISAHSPFAALADLKKAMMRK